MTNPTEKKYTVELTKDEINALHEAVIERTKNLNSTRTSFIFIESLQDAFSAQVNLLHTAGGKLLDALDGESEE